MTIEALFTDGRTHGAFTDEPVPESLLRRLYDTLKWGPTSFNCGPARLVFVASAQARERLLPLVSPGNADKVRSAPVTAIVGMDMEFHEKLPHLSPHFDARPMFVGKPAVIEATAFRNSSLQAAYLIVAARMLGLACGPMSGFDAQKVDEVFWAGTSVKTNMLCNLGIGDVTKLRPRGPRLSFEEVCRIE